MPVLIDSESPDDGCIWLSNGGGWTIRSVKRASWKQLLPFRGEAVELSRDIEGLKAAIGLKSREALCESIVAASRWDHIPGTVATHDFAVPMASLLAFARSQYAFLMNLATAPAQVVVWAPENGLKPPVPAIYCPDNETARFVLQSTSTARLCANKKCRLPFIPSKSGQTYHDRKCGIAERTRRSRRSASKASALPRNA